MEKQTNINNRDCQQNQQTGFAPKRQKYLAKRPLFTCFGCVATGGFFVVVVVLDRLLVCKVNLNVSQCDFNADNFVRLSMTPISTRILSKLIHDLSMRTWLHFNALSNAQGYLRTNKQRHKLKNRPKPLISKTYPSHIRKLRPNTNTSTEKLKQ